MNLTSSPSEVWYWPGNNPGKCLFNATHLLLVCTHLFGGLWLFFRSQNSFFALLCSNNKILRNKFFSGIKCFQNIFFPSFADRKKNSPKNIVPPPPFKLNGQSLIQIICLSCVWQPIMIFSSPVRRTWRPIAIPRRQRQRERRTL